MNSEENTAPEQGYTARMRTCMAPLWPDIWRAGALFFAAFFVGVVYVSTWGGKPEFWQQIFGPSVMVACGEGFANPDLSAVPGLEDFLYLRAESFDCANIPEEVATLPEDTSGLDYDAVQAFHPEPQFKGWTQWQRFHRYLLLSVAFMFYLFGVAWSSLTPLYGVLYGVTTALGYGIFRLGMGRNLATVGGILLLTAPVHLQQLPQLRDYSKAPFFFLIILLAGWILKRPRPMAIQVPLAAIAGVAAGFGLGFRQDVSIAAGMFCLLVALFYPGPFKATAWKRALLVAVFLAGFAVPGIPIIKVLSNVNNATHDTIIGFTRYCDQRLGVEAPLYDFGDPFLDEYVRALLMGYAYRTERRTEVFRHYSADYDRAGKAYFREIVWNFPGDILIRGYASVLRIVDELQISSPDGTPRGVTNQFVARLLQWRQQALDLMPGGGRYHVAAMLLILAALRPRLALAMALGILVFAGYPALRFSERHAFHMQIIALFAALFLIQAIGSAAWVAWRRHNEINAAAGIRAARLCTIRLLAVVAVVASLTILPLFVARGWQARQVGGLLADYAGAERTLLVQDVESREDGSIFVEVSGLTDPALRPGVDLPRPMYTEVLVLSFSAMDAAAEVAFHFQADHPNFQFDRSMTVPASGTTAGGLTHVYYPVYFGPDTTFLGFSLPADAFDHLEAAYRLTDIGDRRILLNAVLPPGWEEAPRYQSLSR